MNNIDKIYQDYLDNIDERAAVETMIVDLIIYYKALSFDQIANMTGLDVYEVRKMVAELRKNGKLALEGLVTT